MAPRARKAAAFDGFAPVASSKHPNASSRAPLEIRVRALRTSPDACRAACMSRKSDVERPAINLTISDNKKEYGRETQKTSEKKLIDTI